jgi:hypothetical protein
MNRQIGPAHSLRKLSPPAGKRRLRLNVSVRGAGGPHPHAVLLACAAVFAQSRRPAPKGFLRKRVEPLWIIRE